MTPKQEKKTFKDAKEWFKALDKYNSEPFFPDRDQPITPERVIFEDDETGDDTHA